MAALGPTVLALTAVRLAPAPRARPQLSPLLRVSSLWGANSLLFGRSVTAWTGAGWMCRCAPGGGGARGGLWQAAAVEDCMRRPGPGCTPPTRLMPAALPDRRLCLPACPPAASTSRSGWACCSLSAASSPSSCSPLRSGAAAAGGWRLLPGWAGGEWQQAMPASRKCVPCGHHPAPRAGPSALQPAAPARSDEAPQCSAGGAGSAVHVARGGGAGGDSVAGPSGAVPGPPAGGVAHLNTGALLRNLLDGQPPAVRRRRRRWQQQHNRRSRGCARRGVARGSRKRRVHALHLPCGRGHRTRPVHGRSAGSAGRDLLTPGGSGAQHEAPPPPAPVPGRALAAGAAGCALCCGACACACRCGCCGRRHSFCRCMRLLAALMAYTETAAPPHLLLLSPAGVAALGVSVIDGPFSWLNQACWAAYVATVALTVRPTCVCPAAGCRLHGANGPGAAGPPRAERMRAAARPACTWPLATPSAGAHLAPHSCAPPAAGGAGHV